MSTERPWAAKNRPPNDLRNRLRRTWTPFLSRFGALTEVQRDAIPPVLEGRNVVIASPTASGKTEAILCPTIERILDNRRSGLQIVYISPTRALVNDMYQRLRYPLSELGIQLHIKTGDRVLFGDTEEPGFLITTPESLDSLLCRSPGRFDEVQTVIIDELHLLDSTARGDQMRCLVARVAASAKTAMTIHGLSATMISPERVGARYMEDPVLVQGGESRELDYSIRDSLESAIQLALNENRRKILVFCNSRRAVENNVMICGGHIP